MRNKYTLLAIIFISFLSACSKNTYLKGHLLDQDIIKAIQPNVTTKTQILDALGTPTSKTSFNREKWYYIHAKSENIAFLSPKPKERSVVAVEFNDNDTVKYISTYTLADGKEIDFVNDATPSRGHDEGVAKDFLSNFGKFNKKKNKRRK
jgi:outer membrane protein assembly factor BamE (lipoprotein component of BamABCDE complex)